VINEIIEQADLKANREAEEGCPVQAIKITKIDG
jgi:ferredoxin